jgi:phosphoglycolate phosphatase
VTGDGGDAPARRRGPIELAVLDMAGTTVRDEGLVERAFVQAMESTGVAADDPAMADHLAFVHSSMGLSKIEVFRALLGDEDAAVAATGAFERAIGAAVSDGEVAPIDGAEAALGRLRRAGVRICLTTGFSADTQALILAALGWGDLVDLALAPGPSLRGRPHPDMVLQAVLALRIDDVATVATVGDTTSDLLSGWRAGAGVVAGVLTGAHRRSELETAPHTHLLASVADLPDLLLGP